MAKTAGIVAVIIVAIIVIGYLIFMFISFKNEKWIFQPYTAQAPTNSCFPQIKVTPLTEDEQNNVKANVGKVQLPKS